MDAREFKAMAKSIGFPGGAGRTATNMSFGWSKSGGHAGGKTVEAVVRAAEKLGFSRESIREGGSPDGSVVTCAVVYTIQVGSATVVLAAHSKYGVTKHDNRFALTLSIREDATSKK